MTQIPPSGIVPVGGGGYDVPILRTWSPHIDPNLGVGVPLQVSHSQHQALVILAGTTNIASSLTPYSSGCVGPILLYVY